MDPNIRSFIVKVLIAAIFMVVLAWIIFTWFLPGQYLPVLPWMLGFFTVVAISTHGWQLYLAKRRLGLFARYSMLISMLRLMMYSAFALVYLALSDNNAAVFVVSLVVVYSIYTMLEVADLARIVKRK